MFTITITITIINITIINIYTIIIIIIIIIIITRHVGPELLAAIAGHLRYTILYYSISIITLYS